MSDVAAQGFRTEHDSMGEVQVPADALWGAQTARAVENFPISGQPVPSGVVHALARLKAAAADVNAELGVLDAGRARAIAQAAGEVADGDHDDEFPIDVFQTGSGTSTNMNVNEVVARLAHLASDLDVHPNDHVNAGQSSNDTFPSALRIAATSAAVLDLVPALEHLALALARKEAEFVDVVKAGRTHLMDAVPVTLGQEFGGYRRQVELGASRVRAAAEATSELPLGGTAAGTGLNAAPGFARRVIERVSGVTGIPFREAANHFEAQSAQDAVVELSGALKVVAVSLTKICNDLRWMSSGPRTGLGEIHLPDLQPGSSIMPGKVNPVVPEATLMACAQVIGNDVTITTAGAAGNFELNVMLPVLAKNILESIGLLASTSRLLADRCVDGITAEVEHARALAEGSPSIVTPLNRYLGYEAAAAVVKQAVRERRTIRDVVVAQGHVAEGRLTEQQLDEALDVLSMTRPDAGA
ncbi:MULTISPECIES: aspartate ammonia-lyase [unclassified Terrabacter]|uniref:class II fumarate hydratase n=1 Tax=unclassified Terrabacter TaxID=2630222 RepID=UPI000700F638|nr:MULTISPECIES: class II fumarate hydratase [unclassified Terrabacter]KRB43666.1 aspartate ammonia-lyase [Terrabacter sp. Root181]KRF46980.1 aspartate ammonia-lyase [Terrabacter sp. Soil810]